MDGSCAMSPVDVGDEDRSIGGGHSHSIVAGGLPLMS
jgi:hypothetical protein